jgi:two-component system NtrC family sensor kinase
MRKASHEAGYYDRLRKRIIIITVLVSLIPVPLVAGSFAKYYKTYIRGAVVKDLSTLANNRKEAIEIFLRERVTLLRTLAYSHSLGSLTAPGELARVLEVLQSQEAGLVDLGVINSAGHQIAYVGPYDLLGKNYQGAKWFQEAIQKGVYVSDTFLGFRHVPHMVVAVKREEEGSFWALRATVDAATFHQLVRSARLGQGGDAFVINRKCDFQVPPRFPQMTVREPSLLKSPLATTAITQFDVGDKKIFQATTWLNNGRWLLVIREDSSAEFFSLESAKTIAAGVFIFALLIISATVVFITNKLINRLQAHEAETESLHEQLAQTSRLASLGKFAAGVAHEINNPLAIIGESAGWMKELLEMKDKDREGLEGELKQSLADIKSEVYRCKEITQRLLGFARKYESKLGPTDVNCVLMEVVQFLYKGASVRNINIHHDFYDDLPMITSDASQLQQVFLNILDNALYAVNTKGGGNITARTRPEGSGVLVTVTDDGPGIPPEVRDKLFDPFFTTKPVGKGTGLGLSICYGIVSKLGGRLWVEHPPEGGAVFKIYLPEEGPERRQATDET